MTKSKIPLKAGKLFILAILLLISFPSYAQTQKTNPDSIPFAPAVSYAAGDGPNSVFCADLDGDGDLDLAVANVNSNSVSILKNNGDGTFSTKTDYPAGNTPGSVFCADLDGDGDLDLVVGNRYSYNVSILMNNGDGTFYLDSNYATGGDPFSVFCADLDGDGDLDLAVTNNDSDNVSILKNNGDGTFQNPVNYFTLYPSSVFCADLDGDGDLDLVVANIWSASVSIFMNNGDGTFPTNTAYFFNFTDHTSQVSTSQGVEGLNGPINISIKLGQPDIGVATSTLYVQLYQNSASGCVVNYTFQPYTDSDYSNADTGAFSITTTDADNGLVTATTTASIKADDYYQLTFGSCDFSRGVGIKTSPGTLHCTQVVGYYCYQSLFSGKPYLNISAEAPSSFAAGVTPWSVFCADLEDDSDLDLVVANADGGGVSILKNNGNGTFQDRVGYATGSYPRSVFCADLDGDLDIDVAVANAGSDYVSILRNNGDGSFQSAVNYGTGDNPVSVFCADLDGDGDLDLAVGNGNNANVSILKNLSDQPVLGTIAGRIKDANTQQNLEGVLVEALQGNIVKGSDNTNNSGQYRIPNLSSGIYDVRASKSGYVTQTQTGKYVFAGQTTTQNFNLNLSPFYFVHITDPHVGYGPLHPYANQRWNEAINAIKNWTKPPDFVLCTGDLVDFAYGPLAFLNWQKLLDPLHERDDTFYLDAEYRIPIYFSPGNHDAAYFYYFDLPSWWRPINFDQYHDTIGPDYYEVKHKNCAIFSLNSGKDSNWPDFTPSGDGLSDQYGNEVTRLPIDLDSLDGQNNGMDNSNYYKIIMMHHPFVNPQYPTDPKPPETFWYARDTFVNACVNYGVNLVLCGHVHDGWKWGHRNKYGQPWQNGDGTIFAVTNSLDGPDSYRKVCVPINPPKGVDVVDSVMYFRSTICFQIDCEAVVHVYDQYGNHDGPNQNGEIEINIPGSTYHQAINDTLAPNPVYTEFSVYKEDTANYSFVIEGLSNDTMNVNVGTYIKEGIWNEAQYDSVLIYQGSVATLNANGSVLDYTMTILDPDSSEREVTPSNWEGNLPPAEPTTPSGPTVVVNTDSLAYRTSSTDPENDQVFYKFDWGDSTYSNWQGPFNSGDTCVAYHSWTQAGTYNVRVRAIDAWDHMSTWSDSLSVIVRSRGDANGDGVINAADVVYLINYLFISGPVPVPLEAGDCNCDGNVNASDVVYLINYLFISGPPPGC